MTYSLFKSRRSVLKAGMAIGFTSMYVSNAFAEDKPDAAGLPANAPTLYYVSAHDCPICRGWNQNYRPAFMNSPERAKLHFVELNTPSVRLGPYTDEAWGPNLFDLREQTKKRRPQGGSPLFVLVQDGHVQVVQAGIGAADYAFYPMMLDKIRSLING